MGYLARMKQTILNEDKLDDEYHYEKWKKEQVNRDSRGLRRMVQVQQGESKSGGHSQPRRSENNTRGSWIG